MTKKTNTLYLIFILMVSLVAIIMVSRGMQKREVVFVVEPGFPPFIYMENEEIKGFDLAVLEEILKGSNVVLKKKVMSWDQALKEVASGAADLISGLDKTDERLGLYLYADLPYVKDETKVFVKKGSLVSGIDDLQGKRIAVQRSSSYHKLLEAQQKYQLVLYDLDIEVLRALDKGTVDAAVGQISVVFYLIKRLQMQDIRPVGEPIMTNKMYFAVNKNDKKLMEIINQGMQRIFADGTYDRLYDESFEKHPM